MQFLKQKSSNTVSSSPSDEFFVLPVDASSAQ
jgi:hypothetical protein